MANVREAVVKTGDVIEGRYRILKVLGEGGMGTVFLAEHTLIKRRVAIKILHAELATDGDVIERFMNEARAAGTLGHPNIVESTDMGFTGNHVPYIVFEYLEGSLLTDEIYRVGGMPVRRAMKIATQIASALHAAHNANIVHRDLKSDNIFLTDKDDLLDHVKVLDFGISRFMETEGEVHTVMGTPEFMAPEQITSPSSVDRRADVYALGVILYEMLEARRPFSNDNDPRALLDRIVHEGVPPMLRREVPHGLVQIILDRMLAKDPDERFQTMMDVAAALEQFYSRDNTPIPRRMDDLARTSSTIPRPVQTLHTPWPAPPAPTVRAATAKPVAKRPVALYGLAAGGLLLGAVGLAFGLMGGSGGGASDASRTAQAQQPPQQPLPGAATQAPRQTQEVKKIGVKIDSNIDGARFVLRRRLQATGAPAMEMSPSDVVELLEVSAPGYKTVRYWLTFDRETHLMAHLDKGTGSVEATEEQTLVALGELASPSTTAAAAAPIVVAAAEPAHAKVETPKTIARPSSDTASAPVAAASSESKPTTRKVGHSDAADQLPVETTAAKATNVHVAQDQAAPMIETAAPATAPPAPPTSEPAPSWTGATTEPPAQTTPPPAQTTPPPAQTAQPPVAQKPPVVAATGPAIVSPKSVHKVSGDAPQIILDHFDGADLPAVITAKLCIDTSGHVTSAVLLGKVQASRLGDEIAATLRTWTYSPYSNSGKAAPVCFPVALRTK
nr:serine/threonine-protein kinase [Kofleriaceae bacterium]